MAKIINPLAKEIVHAILDAMDAYAFAIKPGRECYNVKGIARKNNSKKSLSMKDKAKEILAAVEQLDLGNENVVHLKKFKSQRDGREWEEIGFSVDFL